MTLSRVEVDGIPALFAERTDGVYSGGILFRVGWADENLAVRGLTHLVQHLVLRDLVADVHRHSEVTATYTHVHTRGGSPEQVARMLNGLCEALRDPPVGRLEVTKEALRAEERGPDGAGRVAALLRYGAHDHGLAAFPEVGLPEIGPGLVQVWVGEAFTVGNAMLWFTGDRMPENLQLTLPEGSRQPVPAASKPRASTPAWSVVDGSDLVHVTAVVPPSPAAAIFADVLNGALHHDLRQRDAVSYSAGATYTVRDPASAVIAVTADCLPEQRGAVIGGVVDTLARLRWGEVSVDELTEVTSAAATAVDEQSDDVDTIVPRAVSSLLGLTFPEPHRLAADYRAVTAADVQRVAEAFHRSAIAQVPEVGLGWAGWHAAHLGSGEVVAGDPLPGRDGHHESLVVGGRGVSVTATDTVSTVLYDDVAVMESFADGGRHLVGTDGVQVHVEPTLWEVDDASLAHIDGGVDLARVVRHPARNPDDLPLPPEPLDEEDGGDGVGSRSRWRRLTGR